MSVLTKSALRYAKTLHSYNPIPGGCVLYLPLWHPGLSGPVFKSVDAYRHTTTVTGTAWTPNGRSFNGSSDLITIPHHSSFNFSAFTYIGWVNFTTLAGNPSIINKKETVFNQVNGWHIYWETSVTKWSARIGAQSMLSDVVTVNTGTSYCLALTFSGSVGIFYQNGVAIGETSAVNALVNNTDELRIGKQADDFPGWFEGVYGEGMLYNRALNPLEIQHNYLNTRWRYQ